MPLAQTASQVQKLHCPGHFWEKIACSPKTQKDFCPADVAPHTTTNIPFLSKAVETTPSTSVHGDGHNTEQSRSARRIPTHVPNFGHNVAHRDHTQHIHSARPHTIASLPAHPGPAETPSSTLLIAKIGKTCHVSTQRSVQHDLKHCFVRVSPLARLKTFYLFYESDCRYETDVRFPENLQRFALCCTLCCTAVA